MFDIKKNLGAKIRMMRESKGLTREQFAEKINITPQTIGRIEKGLNFLTAETLESIAKVFGVHPMFFFSPADVIITPYAKRQRQEINDMLDSCTPEQINHIHKIIHILMY